LSVSKTILFAKVAIKVSHVKESSENGNLRQEDYEVNERWNDSGNWLFWFLLRLYFFFDQDVFAVFI